MKPGDVVKTPNPISDDTMCQLVCPDALGQVVPLFVWMRAKTLSHFSRSINKYF
jgi:hypothetical protein